MSEPYLGEIKIMSFGFAPNGWAPCDGQLLPINQNMPLFTLLGTSFGGDGQTNFRLPNLRGRVPVHPDASIPFARSGGESTHTLTLDETPDHFHQLQARQSPSDPNDPSKLNDQPAGGLFAPAHLAVAGGGSTPLNLYGPAANLSPAAPAAVSTVGQGVPHINMMPSLALNFCIALQGTFPSQD